VRSEYEAKSRLWVNGDGCYYERPRTNSEVDIMEWFASLDEDDWEALLDMDEDMDADGCGPVRHDTNGAEGPRERQDELEYNSPPGQINGGGGGGGTCPNSGGFYYYWDCYAHYRNYPGHGWGDYYYSPNAAEQECHQVCYGHDPIEETVTLGEDFWDCMGIKESLTTVACVLTAISIIASASAVTGGAGIVVAFYAGTVAAGIGCGLALHDILVCL